MNRRPGIVKYGTVYLFKREFHVGALQDRPLFGAEWSHARPPLG